jgi:fluoroquinolone resistance protein
MSKIYITDRKFEKTDFSVPGITLGDYENCSFENCNFSNVDLSGLAFSECLFKGCDLSLAKLNKTSFRNAGFKECKMLGLRFENCNDFLFSVDFNGCNLNFTTFFRKKLKKTRFVYCSLQETDFTESDLSGSVFENCDLTRATFIHTILEKTDFRSSFNYSIDPEMNRLKKAKFSLAGIAGLLDKYDIEIE